ncbi:hypothetical protein [Paraburkholderia diazotrophica]|uniref:hypothetical protein n=1 Tax=Paraburkholderia diazotrophica TaxID=667676 RepID=UPI001FECF62A|nr:hypothetical protein [Paraburkholderia diazotrophica]
MRIERVIERGAIDILGVRGQVIPDGRRKILVCLIGHRISRLTGRERMARLDRNP